MGRGQGGSTSYGKRTPGGIKTSSAMKASSEVYEPEVLFRNEDPDEPGVEEDEDAAYQLANKVDLGITRDRDLFAVMKDGDKVIGAIWTAFNDDEYSFDVAVDPEFQGRGLGSKLTDIALDEANTYKDMSDDVRINVRVTSPREKALLERRGLVVEEQLFDGTWMMVDKPKDAFASKHNFDPDETFPGKGNSGEAYRDDLAASSHRDEAKPDPASLPFSDVDGEVKRLAPKYDQVSDEDYMNAVKNNDLESAQAMVESMAAQRGYNVGPVFHGSNAEFNTFSWDKKGQTDSGDAGAGFYFAGNPYGAETYGRNIIKASLKLDNPFVVGEEYMDGEDARYAARRKGEAIKPNSYLVKLTNFLKQYKPDFEPDLDYKDDSFYRLIQKFGADDFTAVLQQAGYDGVYYMGEYITYTPQNIKKLDPVVYDDAGEVIPLSQRFREDNTDIRY